MTPGPGVLNPNLVLGKFTTATARISTFLLGDRVLPPGALVGYPNSL